MRLFKTTLFIMFMLLCYPVVAQESELLSIQAQPQIQWEPGKLELKVQIKPDHQNVWACVGYETLTKFRRSCFQLNGIYSSKTFYFGYKDIPAAENGQAFAELYRAPKRIVARVTANFRVLPKD